MKTLRDEIAIAILPYIYKEYAELMMADGSELLIARGAYKMADAMILAEKLTEDTK